MPEGRAVSPPPAPPGTPRLFLTPHPVSIRPEAPPCPDIRRPGRARAAKVDKPCTLQSLPGTPLSQPAKPFLASADGFFRAFVSGPIIKDKLAFNLGARRFQFGGDYNNIGPGGGKAREEVPEF